MLFLRVSVCLVTFKLNLWQEQANKTIAGAFVFINTPRSSTWVPFAEPQ